ncbi:MAG TPA: hypothetical protein VJL39_00255 [Candidatus Paceibacterota bacterium]
MRRSQVLTVFVALAAGLLVASSAYAQSVRDNVSRFPGYNTITRNVEVCHGARVPRTEPELVTALTSCKGEIGCLTAAVRIRDQVRDRQIEQQVMLKVGEVLLAGLRETLRSLGKEAEDGNIVVKDTNAFNEAIANAGSLGDNYKKAFGAMTR